MKREETDPGCSCSFKHVAWTLRLATRGFVLQGVVACWIPAVVQSHLALLC